LHPDEAAAKGRDSFPTSPQAGGDLEQGIFRTTWRGRNCTIQPRTIHFNTRYSLTLLRYCWPWNMRTHAQERLKGR